MEIIDDLKISRFVSDSTVVTIGNFDGIHKGHISLIDRTLEISQKKDMTPLVITFDPLPQEYFTVKNFFRLMTISDKIEYFKSRGIEIVVKIPFKEEFSKITANSFIKDLLIKQLNIKHLVIGEDFRFGHNRQGDCELLRSHIDFETHVMKNIVDQNNKISSTSIRNLIRSGEIEKANKFLYRNFSMQGCIVHGEKLGRKLGYPTANIEIYKSFPINGIFLVKVHIEKNTHFGLASIGNKPTFSGEKDLLEVFIFDFNQDIYNKIMKVSFLKKLRNQIKFSGEKELIAQMNQDYDNAKKILSNKNGL